MKNLQNTAVTITALSIIGLIGVLSPFLFAINMFGGIVSGIWLAILGEWRVVVIGIVYCFFSSFFITFALMPGLLLSTPAMFFIEKGKKIIGAFFGALSIIYTIGLLIIWCLYVLVEFTQLVDSRALIPALVWSYGVAMTPWMYLAQKDQQAGNDHATYTTFFAEVSYIIAIFMFYFGAALLSILIVFSAIMFSSAAFHFFLALASDQQWGNKWHTKKLVSKCAPPMLEDIELIVDQAIESYEAKSKQELCTKELVKMHIISMGYAFWFVSTLNLFTPDKMAPLLKKIQDMYLKKLEYHNFDTELQNLLREAFSRHHKEYSQLDTGEIVKIISVWEKFAELCPKRNESKDEFLNVMGIPVIIQQKILVKKTEWEPLLNSLISLAS